MRFAAPVLVITLFAFAAFAQVPVQTGVQILKAEDARRYDSVIEGLMRSKDAAIRGRAALAAGRIGDARAIPALSTLLEKDGSGDVRAMAAFALGEIESIDAADVILKAPKDAASSSRVIEAAGKIAATNPKHPKAKELGRMILDVLTADEKGTGRETILLGLTAALRARPEGADKVVARYLTSSDTRIRADAANTLTRLRAKNASDTLQQMLATDADPIARANAARALGAAEDKGAVLILLLAATTYRDARVRVSAIRALASLNDPQVADKLLERGKALLGNYAAQKTENRRDKNEALEIASTLGKLLANTRNKDALKFMTELSTWGRFHDPETAVAWAKIDPADYLNNGGLQMNDPHGTGFDWRSLSANAQGLAELANAEDKKLSKAADERLRSMIENPAWEGAFDHRADPDLLRALAAFQPPDLNAILLSRLNKEDVFVRAAAAELMADQPASKENVEEIKKAFDLALVRDKDYDDAQLGILEALFKLDKKEAVGTLLVALSAPDYLVRKKAFDLLSDKDLQNEFPGISTSLENARNKHKDRVLAYTPAFGTKLGQLLNTDADYRRALSRKNGSVKAEITTVKGMFTIDLLPEDAPLTVDNFIKLARSKYLNGVEVHRVVPNFVMQDGDRRGDGNGGPGWSIRCEINMVPYDRGAVGMALSGKDTGGSQWFVTHSPQPHLDGGYTVFGHVNETGMQVVDNIERGDMILSVKIIEGIGPRKDAKKRQK